MMPTLAPDALAFNLEETTGRLRVLLDALAPPNTAPRMATPPVMYALLSELMRAGQWMRNLPQPHNAQLEHELAEYRRQVERLRGLLPAIQSTLLAEKSRLEHERERLHTAAEWARASRETL